MKSCRLQYGLSTEFDRIVLEQQNVKASKAHIQPNIFDDPDDQELYSVMTDDVMVKTFDSEDEKIVFKKSLEGMK